MHFLPKWLCLVQERVNIVASSHTVPQISTDRTCATAAPTTGSIDHALGTAASACAADSPYQQSLWLLLFLAVLVPAALLPLPSELAILFCLRKAIMWVVAKVAVLIMPWTAAPFGNTAVRVMQLVLKGFRALLHCSWLADPHAAFTRVYSAGNNGLHWTGALALMIGPESRLRWLYQALRLSCDASLCSWPATAAEALHTMIADAQQAVQNLLSTELHRHMPADQLTAHVTVESVASQLASKISAMLWPTFLVAIALLLVLAGWICFASSQVSTFHTLSLVAAVAGVANVCSCVDG